MTRANTTKRFYKTHRGFYKLKTPEKFIMPLDETMQSTKLTKSGLFIEYKSSLEYKFIKYCEVNPHILKFGLESFPIWYVSPKDGKNHRYFVDFMVVFDTGNTILVEIKPYSQTIAPKGNNADAWLTYAINQAKWKAANTFAAKRGMKFIICTEKELK